jgi:hypothetical protein
VLELTVCLGHRFPKHGVSLESMVTLRNGQQ